MARNYEDKHTILKSPLPMQVPLSVWLTCIWQVSFVFHNLICYFPPPPKKKINRKLNANKRVPISEIFISHFFFFFFREGGGELVRRGGRWGSLWTGPFVVR